MKWKRKERKRASVYEKTVEINASQGAIWEIFSDKAAWGKWHDGELVELALKENGFLKWKEGAPSRIVTLKNQEMLATVSGSGVRVEFTLHQLDEGKTAVTCLKNFDESPLMVSNPEMLLTQIERNLQQLKRYAEHRM